MIRFALLLAIATPTFAAESKPNVIIVMTDDNGLGDNYDVPEKKGVSKDFPTIAKAKVEIAGVKGEVSADPKALGATVNVTLPKGKTVLKAWFQDAEGKDLVGAFFVYVSKK